MEASKPGRLLLIDDDPAPRLALASLLGRPLPPNIDFCDRAVVRFLDERFLDPADIARVGLELRETLA